MVRIALSLIRMLPEMAEQGLAASYGRTPGPDHAQVSLSGEPWPMLP